MVTHGAPWNPMGPCCNKPEKLFQRAKKTKNVNKKLTQNYEQLFGLQNDWCLQVFWCIGCRIAGFCFFNATLMAALYGTLFVTLYGALFSKSVC